MNAPMLLNEWSDSTPVNVFEDFSDYADRKIDGGILAKPEFQGVNILIASYSSGSYEGDAFVLFEKEGHLFETSGSHCSCYVLEGQCDPEETTSEAIRHRMTKGSLGQSQYSGGGFVEKLEQVLDAWDAAGNAGAEGGAA